MKIELINIDKLKPAKYNPRKDLKPGDPEYEHLKRSIEEFTLVEPLVWNKRTGNLVGGHQRLKILKARGDTHVDVSVVDLDDAHEKALNVALNKIQGDWNPDMLLPLLDDIKLSGIDVELTGFTAQDISLMSKKEVQEDDFDAQAAAEAIKEPVTKPGDIWILGKHRLCCGDSTKREYLDKLMMGAKADMLNTDPPYGVNLNEKNLYLKGLGRGRDWGDLENDVSVKDLQPFLTALFGTAKDFVKAGGAWYIWYAQTNQHIFEDALKDLDFLIHRYIIWSKPHLIFGRGDYHWQHEPCIYGWVKGVSHQFYGERNQTTIWNIKYDENRNNQSKGVHPTQKPIELAARAIQNSSKVDDIILDVCAGAGFTLMAAEQLNRISYGMEISPIYTDVCVQRWELFTGQKARKQEDYGQT